MALETGLGKSRSLRMTRGVTLEGASGRNVSLLTSGSLIIGPFFIKH